MQLTRLLVTSSFVAIIVCSCKKVRDSLGDCFPDTLTGRQITNAHATIKKANEKFYIIEQGSLNRKLDPCTLPTEFQVDNLEVTLSGDVKATLQGGPGPCCTENFVITRIAR